MFSGIIETTVSLVEASESSDLVRWQLARPAFFSDIQCGDSIAVDGVCLTLEAFDDKTMSFALAPETLKVIKFHERRWRDHQFNVERSLRFGDRVHGHFVTGHVDFLGQVRKIIEDEEWCRLEIDFDPQWSVYIWRKGSLAVNGVSLTINECSASHAEVCLIPETLQRTNLSELKVAEPVHIEIDAMARGLVHAIHTRREENRDTPV